MEKKISYVAFDGEEFETEKECLAYEDGFKVENKDIVFYNDFFEPLDSDNLDATHYIYIKTSKGLANVKNRFKYEGFTCDGLNSLGCYYYSVQQDEWVSLEKELNRTANFILALIKNEPTVYISTMYDEGLLSTSSILEKIIQWTDAMVNNNCVSPKNNDNKTSDKAPDITAKDWYDAVE